MSKSRLHGIYLRHAIQTHFVEIGEDYIELVNRYVKPLYEEGDLLSISEKIIALCQKRVVYRKDMKISWLAKFLSRFAIQHNSAGIGVGEVCKMQFAINECGAWKVLWAAICAGFGKLVGKHGIFYDMVGMEVTGLDGFYPDVFPVYGDYGIRILAKILGVCNEIFEKTGVRNDRRCQRPHARHSRQGRLRDPHRRAALRDHSRQPRRSGRPVHPVHSDPQETVILFSFPARRSESERSSHERIALFMRNSQSNPVSSQPGAPFPQQEAPSWRRGRSHRGSVVVPGSTGTEGSMGAVVPGSTGAVTPGSTA